MFENITDTEELKKAYRKACLEHHPDMGGDADIFRQVKSAYIHRLKELLDQSRENNNIFRKSEILNMLIHILPSSIQLQLTNNLSNPIIRAILQSAQEHATGHTKMIIDILLNCTTPKK